MGVQQFAAFPFALLHFPLIEVRLCDQHERVVHQIGLRVILEELGAFFDHRGEADSGGLRRIQPDQPIRPGVAGVGLRPDLLFGFGEEACGIVVRVEICGERIPQRTLCEEQWDEDQER